MEKKEIRLLLFNTDMEKIMTILSFVIKFKLFFVIVWRKLIMHEILPWMPLKGT